MFGERYMLPYIAFIYALIHHDQAFFDIRCFVGI